MNIECDGYKTTFKIEDGIIQPNSEARYRQPNLIAHWFSANAPAK